LVPPCNVPGFNPVRSDAFPCPDHQLTRPDGRGTQPPICASARYTSRLVINPMKTMTPCNCRRQVRINALFIGSFGELPALWIQARAECREPSKNGNKNRAHRTDA